MSVRAHALAWVPCLTKEHVVAPAVPCRQLLWLTRLQEVLRMPLLQCRQEAGSLLPRHIWPQARWLPGAKCAGAGMFRMPGKPKVTSGYILGMGRV